MPPVPFYRLPALKAVVLWTRALPAFFILGSLFLFLRVFKSRRRLDPFVKWSCRLLVRLLGIRVRVEGLERIDPARAYTFLINHVTAIDHFVAYGVLPHYGKGLEAAENFRIPFYGWLMRAVGNYPVPRQGAEESKQALEACARDALAEGFSVFCAPEGTRSRDGCLGKLKSGVFRLALACGRDVVPVVLLNLHAVLPPGEWRLEPRPVTVRVLPPIPVAIAHGGRPALENLKRQVWNAFVAAGLTPRPGPRPEGGGDPRST